MGITSQDRPVPPLMEETPRKVSFKIPEYTKELNSKTIKTPKPSHNITPTKIAETPSLKMTGPGQIGLGFTLPPGLLATPSDTPTTSKRTSVTPSVVTPSLPINHTNSASAHLYMTPMSVHGPCCKPDAATTPVRQIGTHKETFASSNLQSPTKCPILPTEEDEATLSRRKRRRTSPNELQVLDEEFARCMKPTKQQRREISRRLGMAEKSVRVWFQNRRQAHRRHENIFLSSSSSQSSYGDEANSDTGHISIEAQNSLHIPAVTSDKSSEDHQVNGYERKQMDSAKSLLELPNSHQETMVDQKAFHLDEKLAASQLHRNESTFTIYNDADTDDELERTAVARDFLYGSRLRASQTLSSVRTTSSLKNKRQFGNRKVARLSNPSAISPCPGTPRLSMSMNGKAQVVVDHKPYVPASTQQANNDLPISFSNTYKRLALCLDKTPSMSVVNGQLNEPRSSPTKRAKLMTGGTRLLPPTGPQTARNLTSPNKRSPLSSRKAMPHRNTTPSPSKHQFKKISTSTTPMSLSKEFPTLPKSQTLTSALLMRQQSPANNRAAKPTNTTTQHFRQSCDLSSSPPCNNNDTNLASLTSSNSSSTSSSSSSSSSVSGSPPSRKHGQSLGMPANLTQERLASALTYAAAAAATSTRDVMFSSSQLRQRARRRRYPAGIYVSSSSSIGDSCNSSSSSGAESDDDDDYDEELQQARQYRQVVASVETQEKECINNLLSLRAGTWAA